MDDAANATGATGATKQAAKGELFVRDNGLAVATCGRIFVDAFYAPPTVQRLDELARHQRALVDRVGRHAVLSIIDPGVGKEMGDDARKRARVLANEMEPHTIGHSFVVLGNGFFAAMVRSVIAGVQFVSRSRSPWRVTSDVNDGVAFIADLVRTEAKDAVDDVALRALVEDLLRPATRAAS